MEFPTDNAYDRRGINSNFYKMTNGTLLANNPYTKELLDKLLCKDNSLQSFFWKV